MDTFGQRTKRLRDERGWSQDQLAAMVGVTGPAISNIENGDTDADRMRGKNLRALAKAFGKSEAYMRTGQDAVGAAIVEDVEEEPLADSFVSVPLFRVQASAGPGVTVPEFLEEPEKVAFKRSWLRKIKAQPDDIRVVEVTGSSMEPYLFPGDKVAINKREVVPVSGHVYVLFYEGELRVKRVFREKGTLRLVSDNADKYRYPDETLTTEEAASLHIEGRVRDRSGSGGM